MNPNTSPNPDQNLVVSSDNTTTQVPIPSPQTASEARPTTTNQGVIALFIVLAVMPVVGTIVAALTANDSNERQYTPLVLILMGVYNIPALAVAGLAYWSSNHFSQQHKARVAKILLVATIIVCLAGIASQVAWIISALNDA